MSKKKKDVLCFTELKPTFIKRVHRTNHRRLSLCVPVPLILVDCRSSEGVGPLLLCQFAIAVTADLLMFSCGLLVLYVVSFSAIFANESTT